jgi:hypothetical protein
MQPQARSMHPLHPYGMHGMQGRAGAVHCLAMQPQGRFADLAMHCNAIQPQGRFSKGFGISPNSWLFYVHV